MPGTATATEYRMARELASSLSYGDGNRYSRLDDNSLRRGFIAILRRARLATYYVPRDIERVNQYFRHSSLSRGEFAALLNEIMGEPFFLDTCDECEKFEVQGGLINVRDDAAAVCTRCLAENYYECGCCGQYAKNEDRVNVNGYGSACQDCIDSGRIEASTCPSCEEMFITEVMEWSEADDCYYCQRHTKRSQCGITHPDFEFPALCTPQKTVMNDETIPVTVAHGDVGENAVYEISQLVYKKTSGKWGGRGLEIAEICNDGVFDRSWQTREGNFPKRLAKHLLIEHHLKLTDEFMAEIGNIAKANAGAPGTHYISLTRDLNRPREEFYNDGSCWWTEESQSRCEAKAWHVFGVRTWSRPDGDASCVSRAWLVPLSVSRSAVAGDRVRFASTHVTPADAYVLFNPYGIEHFPYARMVAGMVGKSYRKIGFSLADAYINNGGVLIAEQSICDAVDEIELPKQRTCSCRHRRD